MKKLVKNLIVFVLIGIFVLTGISRNMIHMIAANVYHLAIRDFSVSETIGNIEAISVKDLNYYGLLNDINSIRLRIQGNKVINKDEDIVVKMTNEYLTYGAFSKIELEKAENSVKKIKELETVCKSNNAKFLYVLAPNKNYFGNYSKGLKNYGKYNIDTFAALLRKDNVNYLNLAEKMNSENLSLEDSFFITDHHWKPKTGFWATKRICERLNYDFEFDYDDEYLDLNNYNIKTYDNWFLGSEGKKAGVYFSKLGVDSFDLIIPKFKTELKENQPLKAQTREGEFKDTVLYMSNLEKDLYRINTYATYSGGDFRLQIITNNLSENDKKILVIRDSYGCVVTPFLALQTKEVHVVDIRTGSNHYGDKVDVEDYIKKINPDYVVVLYTGCPIDSGKTDF